MIDIAAAAGVAKGLVYWYFDNKDTLFDEIVVDIGERLRRAQGRAIADIDDPLERLYVGTAESVRFVAGNYRLYGIISSQVRGDRRLRETRSRTQRVQVDDAAALLAEGQARGVIRGDDDATTLAFANFGVVYQFVLLHAEGGEAGGKGAARHVDGAGGVTVDAAAHAAARYVVRAVGADAATVEAVLDRCASAAPPDQEPRRDFGHNRCQNAGAGPLGVPASDGPRRAERFGGIRDEGDDTMASTFLSDEWFEAVEGLRDEAPEPPAAMKELKLNIVVAGGPDGDREIHMAAGQFERGLVDDAPTKLTVPYDVAKAMFIEGNQQAAMQAFMSGQIKVEGDMTKLMAMQAGGPPTAEQTAFQEKIRGLTE